MVFWDLFVADSWHVRDSRDCFPFSSHTYNVILGTLHWQTTCVQPRLHRLQIPPGRRPAYNSGSWGQLVTYVFVYNIMCSIVNLLTSRIVSVWMFRFSNEVISEIVTRTLASTPPRYHTIKELDRKVREFILPSQTVEAIRGGPGVDLRSVPVAASMLSYMLGVIGDVSKSMSF